MPNRPYHAETRSTYMLPPTMSLPLRGKTSVAPGATGGKKPPHHTHPVAGATVLRPLCTWHYQGKLLSCQGETACLKAKSFKQAER